MSRLIAILLCVCSAVICAFLAYLGYQSAIDSNQPETPPTVISCRELLDRVPPGLHRIVLTEYQPGDHYVSFDDDNDGKWDRVFVPMFPDNLKQLKQNYRAVIVSMADVDDEFQLKEKIKSGNLPAEYWYTFQSLDNKTYNRLAAHYNSMNFDRSITLYSGFPPDQNMYARLMFWGALAGAALSVLGIGWQCLGLLVEEIRRKSYEDKFDDRVISNRAGLPTTANNDFV